jgi:hypothetical protein
MKQVAIVVVGLVLGLGVALFVVRSRRPVVSDEAVVEYAVSEVVPSLAFIGVRQCDASLAGLPVSGTATFETTADGIRVAAIQLRTDEETPRTQYLPCLVKHLTGKVHLKQPGLGPEGAFEPDQRFEVEADWVLPDVTPSQMK